MSQKFVLLCLCIIAIFVFSLGCTDQPLNRTQVKQDITQTIVTPTPTKVKPTPTKELYNPRYSRGDLILMKDPVDIKKSLMYKDTIKMVTGIDLEGKKLGELIINTTWNDPTFPGEARYNYKLMYESAPSVWSFTNMTMGVPATTIDNYTNELIKQFPNLDVENTTIIRI